MSRIRLMSAALGAAVLGGVAVAPVAFADDLPPNPPGFVTAKGGLWNADIRWTPPTSGQEGLTGYQLSVSPGGKTYTFGLDARDYRVPSLSSGTTYTFTVRALNTDGAGPGKSHKLIGTRVTLTPSSQKISYDLPLSVGGELTRIDTGARLTNKPVQLWWRKAGTTTWEHIGDDTTSTSGRYYFDIRPPYHFNADLRVRYPSGNWSYMGGYSNAATVAVAPNVTAAFDDSTIGTGEKATLTGTVDPSHAGQQVHLQRYYSGAWHTVHVKALNADSEFSFPVGPSVPGVYSYRVLKPADTDHAAGHSATKKLTISS